MKYKKVMTVIVSVALLTAWGLQGTGEEQERAESKSVLVVMDVQNIWIPKMAKEDVKTAPEKINEAIALFREFGCPVIRVYHSSPQYGPAPDTEPFEFLDSIAIKDDDQKIVKNHASAFTKTDLEKMLRKDGYDTVFLCGLSATGCVLATYFGAMDRGFKVAMIEGALLSHDASYTKVIEDICRSMTIEELKKSSKEQG